MCYNNFAGMARLFKCSIDLREKRVIYCLSMLIGRGPRKIEWGVNNAWRNYSCMHRMQAPQLSYEQEQEEYDWTYRNDEVLQMVPQTHSS